MTCRCRIESSVSGWTLLAEGKYQITPIMSAIQVFYM